MKLFLLLLFCRDLFAVKHSLKFFGTGSSGIPNIPDIVAFTMIDGILAGYCDSNNKMAEPRMDCAKTFLDENPEQLEWYTQQCSVRMPNVFRAWIFDLKQQLNQSEGVHILQRIDGCEWDENTGAVTGFSQYGFNGEDFLELDLKTQTWRALRPEAVMTKQRWDADRTRIKRNEFFLTQICPEWLKLYLDYGKACLQRTVLPSVSLLQKTPSSPVSCHATGFYPDRAMMFWRKDGEELHEGMGHREILPNNDGTFQMSVDLNVSLITPEDWRRYECVFQLSDIKDNIVTELQKSEIGISRVKTEVRNETTTIIVVVIVLVLILVAAVGVAVYKKKKEICSASPSGNMSDLSETLNQETNTEPCKHHSYVQLNQ